MENFRIVNVKTFIFGHSSTTQSQGIVKQRRTTVRQDQLDHLECLAERALEAMWDSQERQVDYRFVELSISIYRSLNSQAWMAEKANQEREVPKEKLVSRWGKQVKFRRFYRFDFSLQAIPVIQDLMAEMEFRENLGELTSCHVTSRIPAPHQSLIHDLTCLKPHSSFQAWR